jgi:hypothetical protein
LTEVIDRARQFNATPGYLVKVAELTVFGSYLDPAKDRLGDLDLAVKLRDLLAGATCDEFAQRRLAYASARGRQFNTFISRLDWPEHEALLALRKRSPTINITTQDVSTLTNRWEIVFRADDPAVKLNEGCVDGGEATT